MRHERIFLLIGALLLAATSVFAARAPVSADGYSIDIVSIDDSRYPALSAVINVLDGAGRPVAGLNAGSFQARVDGKPAHIDGLQTAVDAEVSLAVALVVDVSGSMQGEPLAQARLAATDFVRGLSPQDSVAVLTFSNTVSLVQDFTTDKEAAVRAIDGLTAGGNTALYQAAAEAAAKASGSPSPRRVIILLSDGVDYGELSAVSREDSIEAVRAAGVPTYTIGLGTEIDRDYLTQIAQASRARFLETPTAEGLRQLYAEIGNLLRSQYLLNLTSPASDRSKPLSLELSVIIDGAQASTVATLPAVGSPTPSISLSGLADGQEVTSEVTVAAEVEAAGAVQSVAFLIDGKIVAERTSPPYEFSLDPASLPSGRHVLSVEATGSGGAISRAEAVFTASAPAQGGGGPPLVAVGAGIVLVLGAGAAGFAFWHWRYRRIPRRVVEVRLRPWSAAIAQGMSLGDWPQLREQEEQEPEPQTKPERLGKLTITSGTGQGQEFIVGSKPVSIGSAPWCGIVLPEDDGRIGLEEARAWVHQSRKLIFHRLTRLSVIAAEGSSGGWFVLEDGDEITLGSHRLMFTLVGAETEEEQSLGRAIDEALRGFGGSSSGLTQQRESA